VPVKLGNSVPWSRSSCSIPSCAFCVSICTVVPVKHQ
jgi:hypothetical protein